MFRSTASTRADRVRVGRAAGTLGVTSGKGRRRGQQPRSVASAASASRVRSVSPRRRTGVARDSVGGDDVTEHSQLRSRSLRRRLARTENVLDMAVGPSYTEEEVREGRKTIQHLNVELHGERYRRAEAEDRLRDTEQLMALKLDELKTLSRRVKRMEAESELQMQLEQESQKTFEFLGQEVGEVKSSTAEGIATLRGEVAREMKDMRTAMALSERSAAEQVDNLLSWVEKTGQEVVNLNTRMDGMTKRTASSLERFTVQAQDTKRRMQQMADDGAKDATALRRDIEDLKSKVHELERRVAQSDAGSTGVAAANMQAAAAAKRSVSLHDVRHQEVQQSVAALQRESAAAASTARERLDGLERSMSMLSRRVERQVATITESVNDEREWVKTVVASLERSMHSSKANAKVGGTTLHDVVLTGEAAVAVQDSVGRPRHDAATVAELVSRIEQLEADKEDLIQAVAEATATAVEARQRVEFVEASSAAQIAALQHSLGLVQSRLGMTAVQYPAPPSAPHQQHGVATVSHVHPASAVVVSHNDAAPSLQHPAGPPTRAMPPPLPPFGAYTPGAAPAPPTPLDMYAAATMGAPPPSGNVASTTSVVGGFGGAPRPPRAQLAPTAGLQPSDLPGVASSIASVGSSVAQSATPSDNGDHGDNASGDGGGVAEPASMMGSPKPTARRSQLLQA